MIYSVLRRPCFPRSFTIAVETMSTPWTMNMTGFESGRRHVAA